MKNFRALFFTPSWMAVAALALIQLSSCGRDPDPVVPELTEAEKVATLLTAGRWPLTSVTVEGEDAAAIFKDFSITFTNTGYTTTGTTPVWKRSGTWAFTDESATKFMRDDNVEVTINAIDGQSLKLTLQWNETLYGGKGNALRGKHEFVLNK
jgi:hypothetical protein